MKKDRDADWRSLERFAFGDSPELADELAELVLIGKKRATCWAASEGPKTQPGKRWVVLDGCGVPIAVIETVELTQRRFDEVDAAFAFEAGEDDRTLASWKGAHPNYFGGQGTFAPDMLLYCERFRLVARLDADAAPEIGPSGKLTDVAIVEPATLYTADQQLVPYSDLVRRLGARK